MNIYVSHLSWGTSSEGLGNLFAQFGEVASANVITDRETGRSRGFGFVEMPDDDQARKAMEQLNGASFEGQTITVNEARPREERPSGGFGGSRRFFGTSRGNPVVLAPGIGRKIAAHTAGKAASLIRGISKGRSPWITFASFS